MRKLLSDPVIMELINLEGLNLTIEESRDIIKFIAQKIGISTKELLSTIKPNPKCKNNQVLTPEKPLRKPERKNNPILTPEKPLKNPERKNNQILKPEKPLKNQKSKNNQILTLKNNQSQKIMFNNKERIGIIR